MIELASLVSSPTRLSLGNVSPLWKGPIEAESGPTIAYIKVIQHPQLLSEAVCALLGRAIGLLIPKPFIVQVPREFLTDYSAWMDNQESLIAFGSEDAAHPAFLQHVVENGGAEQSFLRWPDLDKLVTFDEWIANIDRHMNNFLYDGNGNFLPIDHGHALTCPNWTPADLDPATFQTNRLLDHFLRFNDVSRQRLKNNAADFAGSWSSLDFEDFLESLSVDVYANIEDVGAVISFLRQRPNHLVSLIARHLGIPELDLR